MKFKSLNIIHDGHHLLCACFGSRVSSSESPLKQRDTSSTWIGLLDLYSFFFNTWYDTKVRELIAVEVLRT